MFAKIEVNGANAADLYKWLKSQQPNDDGSEDIGWNFTKFLVNKDGQVVKRFNPQVTPEDVGARLGGLL